MAAPGDDPLEVINQTYKEILVQTGKHFRALDGSIGHTGARPAIRAKTEDSLARYHFALHDVENEIIRAKSVLLRDLEKLRAAHVPAPQPVVALAPAPAPAPTPTPAPIQTKAPTAPMLELPSAAAHTLKGPSYAEKVEPKTAAPFPDMGMGMSMSMSADIDLSAPVKNNPSPRIQAGSVRPVASRATPPIKTEAKPSPKPAPLPKPTPPTKVTPIPPPQIPRLSATQQATNTTSPNQQKALPASQPPKTAPPVRPPQNAQIIKAAPENPLDSTLGPPLPTLGEGAGTGDGNGNGELSFTDMEFSLAPPPNEPQGGAPPAPMPEFDLANFVPPPGPSEVPTASLDTNSNDVAMSSTQVRSNPNIDDLFNLGNGATDNMFDLGGGEADNSTFDDMMYFGNDNSDMAQFDDAYFGL
ncbi:hypothetical protein GGR57DRAFT_445489 [Xylariaceae sp. FL1272]|nr:hypothetical protein GGR57DRAFT_445489 [Xylariaceae sp. FL1272]